MKEYVNVQLDYSKGSAYEYRMGSKIPTKVKYCRFHQGKFEKGKFIGEFTNTELHNLVYLIKRGFTKNEIETTLTEWT